MAQHHITVESPEGRYDIRIEHGALMTFAPPSKSCAVVTNTTLAPLHGHTLAERLGAPLITMPDGEQYKTMQTVESLYNQFITAGLDRSSTVIALGGGVVGDTAGFAAAIYMRGVPLVQIPTSLLAMVDSSVGGKVGVDVPQGKNLIGAFKQPQAVIIDPDVLRTLPAQEWRCGMAEVIKHGLLADPGLLEPDLHHPERAAELVARAVQVKVDVVQRDPFEKGERAHLNLGHTFGHAVERVTEYRVPHGEGVAIGLAAAVHLSARLGLCDTGLVEHVEMILSEIGLPIRTGALDPALLWDAMATDKKWQGGRSRFVLMRGIGQPVIVDGVSKDDVIAVLEAMR